VFQKPVPSNLWKLAGYTPNEWTLQHVHRSACRFNFDVTSRQVGKTEGIGHELFDAGTAPPREGDKKPDDPPFVGIISFDFDHARAPVDRMIEVLEKTLGSDSYSLNKNDHELRLKSSGALYKWFSAENPRSVQGKTFTAVFIDESQNIPDEMWLNLRPALDVRMAQVFAFGTPDPIPTCSWFKGGFLRGQDEDSPDYHSFTISCFENPWITIDSILDAQSNMSESEFRKKYLGQWVDDEGMVFHNIDANFTGNFLPAPELGRRYHMGLDLAKHDDFTVAYIMDTVSKRVVYRMRFNGLSYPLVRARVRELYRRWNCHQLWIDATSGFEAVSDELKNDGLNVRAYNFSTQSKAKLVATLAREIEHARLILPVEDTELKRELKAYTRTVTQKGNVTYSAPINFHDDCVMALGLAVMGARNAGMIETGNYLTW
jgi:hypothetical protein